MVKRTQTRAILGVSLVSTILSGLLLLSPRAFAEVTGTVNLVATIPSACSLTLVNGTNNEESLAAQITPGTTGFIGTSHIKMICNDSGGLALYAVGYTGNSYGETKLISSDNLENYIPTGTATSGNASAWNMTIANDTSVANNLAASIVNVTTGQNPVGNFGAPHAIPSIYTKVAYRDSGTDTGANAIGSNVTASFNAYVSPTQPAGDYHGKVKFTLVHPSAAQVSQPATLDTGQTVNAKMKSLAAGSSKTYSASDSLIKSISVHTNASAPSGFTASDSNTISSSASEYPIYIVFDNTNDAGTMHLYTNGDKIVLSQDASYMFNYMMYLSDFSDLADWDTSNVTSMNSMFRYACRVTTAWSINLSNWDTSNVADMNSMFLFAGYAVANFSLDLSSWDTSSVVDMGDMFYSTGYNSTNFSLDLSDWDTSNATSMTEMFEFTGYNSTNFSLVGLSGWDTSKVQNTKNMFNSTGFGATATWSIGNLSGWDISEATDTSYMFSSAGRNATTWSIGNLSGWDVSNAVYMSHMFDSAGYNATNFSLDLSDWDTSKAQRMDYLFANVGRNSTSFSLDLSGWDASSATNVTYMFNYAGYSASSFSLDLSGWDTSKVTSMSNMFSSAGNSATAANWSVTISQTNGNNINNTTSRLYGKTTSTYATPPSGKAFTLAQP